MAGDAVLSQFKQAEEVAVVSGEGKKLKVGIIGTGWIAESHIDSYKRMPDVEIVAAADLIPGKAEKFCKKFGVEGVRCYPDHKSMLENEELDAVSVCTYNTQHAVCTIDALDKGVNVLLEKPMCVTTEEAVEMLTEYACANAEEWYEIWLDLGDNLYADLMWDYVNFKRPDLSQWYMDAATNAGTKPVDEAMAQMGGQKWWG